MENKYVITTSGTFIDADSLKHYGIKNMKWGIRRYQNPDGSLTPAGRKRYMNPDGTLNKKGEKYYKKESERLKAEKAKLNAQKKTEAKFDKLDKMRKANNELEDKVKGKTADDDSTETKTKLKSTSEMNDKELQDKVNRLRNEDAYRDLNKKLGYDDGSKTELDVKISEMKKQKEYLELQRDIKNLTPKQENKMKKLFDKVIDEVLIPSAIDAGKKTLTSYLNEAGSQAVGKAVKKEVDKVSKTVNKSVEKNKEKVAKEEAKEEAKAEKQKAKEEAKAEKEVNTEKQQSKEESKTEKQDTEKVYTGTVEGVGTSSRKNPYDASWKKTGGTVDAESWTSMNSDSSYTSMVTTRNTDSGRSYISGYLNSPISNLLPPPKDDD